MAMINANSEYVRQAQGLITKAKTPEHLRSEIRPLRNNPVDRATISAPELKTQSLELAPEVPEFDESQASYQQCAGTGTLCLALGINLPDLQAAAKEFMSEKALGL
ncbi:MAG: hypothetical protein MUC35_01230 [Candidatus Margulisbacteria bacterium]|jgi:hypothetical protein|nr:hypothetical protein [Candidatus Margulisiibacteriota bacterium]